MASDVFERIEKKYILSETQYKEVMSKLLSYMDVDSYGKSTIMSLYFDTEDDLLIRRSSDAPNPTYKEKFRIRSYGIPDEESLVFLELKKKFLGTVYKRRISMKEKDVKRFLNGDFKPDEMNQILKEIRYFLDFYHADQKILISYERSAYYMKNQSDSLRVTFDENIRARYDDLDMKKGSGGTLLKEEPFYVMEVKADYAIPLWLTSILSESKVYHSRFSKYASFYFKTKEGEHKK